MSAGKVSASDDRAWREAAPLPTVLIVSPHFPPSTLAGVHRARHLAKHLPAHGWRPVIVRVHEDHYPERPDPALAALVPDSVVQVRTGAYPARLARAVGIGDIGIRAFSHLASAAATAAREENASAILITGSPFYPMLMASGLRRRLGIPVILDFQDPWVTPEGAERPLFSKGRMAHRLAVALEPRAVRGASWITSVSETQNLELHGRHPWIDPSRMTAIPIGGDPEDFQALCATTLGTPALALASDKINLCYIGTFLPRAGPVVRTLFQALSLLKRDTPKLAEQLRLTFVGTSNQPPGMVASPASHLVSPIAAETGVSDLVLEHPPRVPFVEALDLMARANGLLLLGSDEPHYTASKIYPALMSGRPYLSIFHSSSSSHRILSGAGGGAAIAFNDVGHLPSLVTSIASAIRRLAEQPATLGSVKPESYADYTASAVARKFADVLERVRL
jgi:hypothetical protein